MSARRIAGFEGIQKDVTYDAHQSTSGRGKPGHPSARADAERHSELPVTAVEW